MCNKEKNKIIAVTMQKGGTGKTATVVNVVAMLSMMINPKTNEKYKVLLIDADVHSTATHYLNVYDENNLSILDVLNGNCSFDDAIITSEYDVSKKIGVCKIDVIPSNINLGRFDRMEYKEENGLILKNAMEQSEKLNDYDFVFIDCPPESELLLGNVYNASKYFIIPVFPDSVSFGNVGITYQQINSLKENDQERIVLGGVINKFMNYPHYAAFRDVLLEMDDMPMFQTIIPFAGSYDYSVFVTTPAVFLYKQGDARMKKFSKAIEEFTLEFLEKINNEGEI